MGADSQGYAELLRRARSGDRAAFDAIQRSLQGRVQAFVYQRVGADALSEDLVQDAFLSLWTNLARIRSEAHLLPYLYRIVRNLCHDQLRRRQQHRTWLEDRRRAGETAGLVHALAGPAADEAVHWRLACRQVEAAMARLPDVHRETLHLRFREGFTYEQVAEATGVDVGTVKSRIHYARRALVALLPPDLRSVLGPPTTGDDP